MLGGRVFVIDLLVYPPITPLPTIAVDSTGASMSSQVQLNASPARSEQPSQSKTESKYRRTEYGF